MLWEILKNLRVKIMSYLYQKIKKKFSNGFFTWSLQDPLMINKLGIPEPISNKVKYPNILLVPLVAFDKEV